MMKKARNSTKAGEMFRFQLSILFAFFFNFVMVLMQNILDDVFSLTSVSK